MATAVVQVHALTNGLPAPYVERRGNSNFAAAVNGASAGPARLQRSGGETPSKISMRTSLQGAYCRHSLQGCSLQFGQQLVAQKERRNRRQRSVRNLATTEPPTQDQDLNIEDLDDADLDELFEEYGEVVRGEETPTSAEVDDDADSLAFAVAMAEAANEVKGGDIRVLCVKPLVYWTRFFVIATGFSRPQVDAIAGRIRDLAEQKYKRTPRGDVKPNAWTLLDFGDVVVHIFFPKERSFYNLEEFYGNATLVQLPFESETRDS